MDGFFKHSRKLLQQTARDKRLTAADHQVLNIAMFNTRSPGDTVGLGIDFLVYGTQLDRSTVIRSRRHLVELGYLISNGKGQRGLSLFIIPTGGVDATPEQSTGGADATCGVDATGGAETTGTGGVDATGTSGVDATQIETGDMETTTYTQNAEKPPRRSASADEHQNPRSKEEPKGKSSTQGNQNPSPTPSRPKVTWDGTRIIVPDAFLESWRDAYPCVDLDMAVKRASSWCLSNPGKRPKKDYAAFMNRWLGKVRSGSPEYIDLEEQAATDAELIRGAEMSFDDPDERADYWWRCKSRGEYVPSGADCRPMPTDKEVAI